MWCTISKGNVWRGRLLNRNKDGSDFWGDTIIIPFVDHKTGKITQYIAIRRVLRKCYKNNALYKPKKRSPRAVKTLRSQRLLFDSLPMNSKLHSMLLIFYLA